jgi:hypothetical protein
MTKKLTKIVNEEDLNKKHTIKLKSGVILESRDYDFSSPEAVERMKKIREKQKALRNSIIYTRYDLDKASSPYSRPYSPH